MSIRDEIIPAGDDVKPLTTSEIRTRLRARYAAPRWAYLEEVFDTTGVGWSGSCDALAISGWRSHTESGAIELLGFEIKASRADWLAERKKPHKAATFKRFCDRWYLVLGHRSIARLEEVPDDWGVMVAYGETLRISRAAPLLRPVPPTRDFLAALARRMVEQSAEAAYLKAKYDEGVANGFAAAMRAHQVIAGSLEMTKHLRSELLDHANRLERLLELAPAGPPAEAIVEAARLATRRLPER